MSNGQGSQGGGGPVIAAVDGSDHSLRALEWARLAALRHGTGLMVAHVLPEVSQLYAGRRSALHDPNEPEEYADPSATASAPCWSPARSSPRTSATRPWRAPCPRRCGPSARSRSR